MRVLRLIVPTLAVAVLAAATQAAPSRASPSPYWASTPGSSFFSPTSVWNQELSFEAPIDPSSGALVAMLTQTVAAQQKGKYGPWLSSNGFSTPIYTVPESQATTPVTLETTNPYLQAALQAVPLPPEAQPASGSDGQLVVWQPSTQTMWEFWRLRRTATGWAAKWGGVMDNVSTSPGMYTPGAYPGARTYWGATASGLPLLAGLITIADLQQGHVDHALALGIPETKYKSWSWPATHTDGQRVSGIPEGTHLRLNPSLNLAALNLPPLTLMLARAAQRYGVIVRDSAPTIQFYAEEPTIAASNPYPALLGGQYPWQLLGRFPWGSLEVLQQQIDSEPPWATILGTPAKLSSEPSATFTFSSSKPGSVFECEVDSAPSPTQCDGGTFSVQNLSNGWHLFQVRAIDADGLQQPWAHQYWWRVDADAPVTTLSSSPAALTNQSTAQFAFSARDQTPSEFQCQLDGGAWSACWSGITYGELDEGAHTFHVLATDAAGNRQATPLIFTWTIDTTPPITSIAAGPPSINLSTAAAFTLSSTKDAASIQCSLDGAQWRTCLTPQQCELLGSELTGCSGTTELSGLSEGTHTLRVRATDAAGNTDPNPASYTWTVDTQPPVTSFAQAPSGVSASSSASFSFSAADATASTFQCQLDGGPWWSCSSPLSLSALGEGSHTVVVRASDAAGYLEVAPPSASWVVDTDAPVTQISEGPSEATAGSQARLEFAAADTTAVSFECRLDSDQWTPCSSPQEYSGLADGAHTFQVRATDAAGNIELFPPQTSWVLDNDRPGSRIVEGPSGPTASASARFAFAATDSTPSRFECRLDGGEWSGCSSPAEYTGLTDGPHTFQVRATDAAGNVELSPPQAGWVVDSDPPLSRISEGPSGTTASPQATFVFAAADTTPSSFECRLDAGEWSGCSAPQEYTGLADGPHTFEVRATDTAGNQELAAQTRAWTIDTVPPTTTITGAPAALTNAGSAFFTLSASKPGSSFSCQLDAGEWAPCSSSVGYTNLNDATHTFRARATDSVGNVQTSPAQDTWTVDTTPPGTTITSSPAQGISRTGAASFTFTSSEPAATYQCELDEGGYSSCSSPASYSGLIPGPHTFTVRASDQAGNTDPDPPSQSILVSIPKLFAPSSYLNAPLDPGALQASESAELLAELESQVNEETAARTGPTIVTSNTTTDVYVVAAGTPTVKVGGLPKGTPLALQQALAAVPIPAGARPTNGRASQITILQPSSERLWELRGVWRNNGGWFAAWGGLIEGLAASPGYFIPPSWGAGPSAIPLAAGMITQAELQNARIDHALAMQIPTARAQRWSWPAQRTDGGATATSAIPEGARFRLDPTLNIASLHLSPLISTLAQAAQRYGIVVRGQATQVSFYAEEPTGTSPYPSIFGRTPIWQQLASFPWSHLQVLALALSP